MRKGGGKAKGGKYENVVARMIAEAFKPFGITEDDCYRTKNSGATVRQPGDIQMSPALAKLFPAIIECKHYRSFPLPLCVTLDKLNKSHPMKEWMKQIEREGKGCKGKFKLLVMRQNRCPDVVGFFPEEVERGLHLINTNRVITSWKKKAICFLPLSSFLKAYVEICALREK